jgi:hypothetical protein
MSLKNKKQMTRIQIITLIVISIITTSCLPPIDPDPSVKIEVDNNALTNIDSLALSIYDTYYKETYTETQHLSQNNNIYYFGNGEGKGDFKIKLKNGSSIIITDKELHSADKLLLKEKDGKFYFNAQNELPIYDMVMNSIIALLIIFLIKVPFSFFMKTIKRKEYLVRYLIFYLLFILACALLNVTFDILGLNLNIVFFFIYLVVPNYIDISNFMKYALNANKEGFIVKIILINLVLLILWQYLNMLSEFYFITR